LVGDHEAVEMEGGQKVVVHEEDRMEVDQMVDQMVEVHGVVETEVREVVVQRAVR